MLIKLQRWPLLLPLFSAVIGLMLSRTDVVSVVLACWLVGLAIIVLYLLKQRWALCMLVFGVLWGTADLLLDGRDNVVDASWLQGEMMISAEVERVDVKPAYVRYVLSHVHRDRFVRKKPIQTQLDHGKALAGKALLYHYRYGVNKHDVPLVAGQHIRLRVKWRLPRNYQNPGAFDYRGWCFDRHIALIGSWRGDLQRTDAAIPWLEQQRQKVRRALAHADHGGAGVLPALLLGERGMITAQANRAFSATGTAHLLAISGMHVGMAAAWILALIWYVLTRREAWIVVLPVRNLAVLGGLMAACAYATLAAWPLPAVRAAVMLAVAALAWCVSVRSDPINALLLALALIVLLDPSSIASLSLWLSFVATAALLLWARHVSCSEATAKEKPEDPLWWQRLYVAGGSLLWISLLATLATLPLIVATFGRIPVYALPANMIMVPLYSLLVMPAALLGELCALMGLDIWAAACMTLANLGVNAGLDVLTALAALPAGELWAVRPSLAMGMLYAVGMVLSGWCLWRDKRLMAVASALLVLILYVGAVLVEDDIKHPRWIVWDVGQGAASTLLLPNHTVIVVDVPGRSGSQFNGGTTVAAGLRALGVSHVDVLVLSHAQSDHLGGALSLLHSLNDVGQIWLPDVPDAHADKRVNAIESYAATHGIAIGWMAQGDVWKRGLWKKGPWENDLWTAGDGAQFSLHVLWPPRLHDPSNTNNTSLVLRADIGHGVALLWPGDLEKTAERRLLKVALQPVDMMLIPHHGSRSSSHEGFVRQLHPRVAIVQTGKGNRYKFPNSSVLQRYQDDGARVYNTANGAVISDWSVDVLGKGKKAAQVWQWSSNTVLRRDLARAWW